MVILEWNIDPFLKELTEFEHRLNQRLDMWDRIRERVVFPMVTEIFRSAGYGRWEPTQRPNPILYDTGYLFESYVNPFSPDFIEEQTFDSLTLGTSTEYAEFHEFGTERLPARRVFGLLEEDPEFEAMLEREAGEWIERIETEVFKS